MYLCDLARLFPPEAPGKADDALDQLLPRGADGGTPGVYGCGTVLCQLLRPEFMATVAIPLCSDGFVGALRNDKENVQHHQELRTATTQLMAVCKVSSLLACVIQRGCFPSLPK